jgi:hypothetical protein
MISRQNERTAVSDTLRHKREIIHAVGRSLLDINEVDSLMVYDAFHKFGRMWCTGEGAIILKEYKCVYLR